jgi:plasmid stabilization system protein ParE
MRYTVVWTDAASNELARVWMQAADPAAVRSASNEIDRELARNPQSKGVEFYGDRLLVVPPLHATFTVHPDEQEVVVLNVW